MALLREEEPTLIQNDTPPPAGTPVVQAFKVNEWISLRFHLRRRHYHRLYQLCLFCVHPSRNAVLPTIAFCQRHQGTLK